MRGGHLGALVGTLLLLVLVVPEVAGAVGKAKKPKAVVGDECDSGQEFPIRHGPRVYVGCMEFAGANWCARDDDTLELCPDLPITEDFAEMFGDVSPRRKIKSSEGPLIVISEVMIINDDESVVDEDGETADWIELFNASEEDIDLEGWTMTDKENKPQKWVLPGVVMEPGDYILIVASGKDRVSDTAAHTNFKLSSSGEYIGIYRPDGSLSCGIDGEYPRQTVNVPYGIPDYDGSQDLADVEYSFLEEATPGEANSGVQKSGPFIAGAHHTFEGGLLPEGMDLTVTALISENLNRIKKATLVYRTMYGKLQKLTMESDGDNIFTATIPASKLKKGQMIQFYIEATDSKGLSSREPAFAADDWPEYYGTVVRDPELESPDIPTLYWFTEDPEQSTSEDGFRGSVFYRGRYYDNVFTRKRGVTALTWPKPKIKFDFKGTVFKLKKGAGEVEEFNLQSFWDEPGEDSYLREIVGFQVMREAGVPACEAFYVRVNMNSEYYGLHGIIEQVDDVFLKNHDLDPIGPLFKSSHGELSNLRWDVKIGDIPWAYRKGNRPGVDDSEHIHNLITSLGGGGELKRSQFIYDHLNLPQIINYMAVSNMLLNQDRCTKNFYTYMHPVSEMWHVLPWDLEAVMGISSGLGGQPAPDYCILTCEQWNSPFYCDSQHPQEIIDILNIEIKSGRRLSFMPQPKERKVSLKLPSPKVYDEDRTGTPSPSSAPGTYNHIDDAILSWAQTREMYLRRLRTLMDEFLDGRLVEIIREQWALARNEAKIDNAAWEVTPSAIDDGYKQLITEQIPTRKEQLYEVYGPDGYGIIPEAQPEDARIDIAAVQEDYVELSNPNKFAVDVSDWKLSGALDFSFIAGTVIPSEASIYVVPSIPGFRNREESPKGGERLLVVGPSSTIDGYSVTVTDHQGRSVAQS